MNLLQKILNLISQRGIWKPENNPRLKGISSKKVGNLTTINKGIFTSCKKMINVHPGQFRLRKLFTIKIKTINL